MDLMECIAGFLLIGSGLSLLVLIVILLTPAPKDKGDLSGSKREQEMNEQIEELRDEQQPDGYYSDGNGRGRGRH